MSRLRPSQVKQAIDNRPSDVAPEDVIQGLMDNGHELISEQEAKLDDAKDAFNNSSIGRGMSFLDFVTGKARHGIDKAIDAGSELTGRMSNSLPSMIGDYAKLQYNAPAALGKAINGMYVHPESKLEKAGGLLSSVGLPLAEAAGSMFGAKAFENIGQVKNTAQALSVTTGMKPRDLEPVLADLDMFKRAKTLEDANESYGRAIGSNVGISDYLKAKLGKFDPTVEDYSNFYNDVGRRITALSNAKSQVEADKLPQVSPQETLAAIQAINKRLAIKDYSNNEAVLSDLLELKGNLVDAMGKVYPMFRQANTDLREAHLIDNFSHIMPQNKNMSPNQLKGWLMLYNAAKAGTEIAGGNVLGGAAHAAASSLSSPFLVGNGLKMVAAMGHDLAPLDIIPTGEATTGAGGAADVLSEVKNPLDLADVPEGDPSRIRGFGSEQNKLPKVMNKFFVDREGNTSRDLGEVLKAPDYEANALSQNIKVPEVNNKVELPDIKPLKPGKGAPIRLTLPQEPQKVPEMSLDIPGNTQNMRYSGGKGMPEQGSIKLGSDEPIQLQGPEAKKLIEWLNRSKVEGVKLPSGKPLRKIWP